jgi:GTP 3',8-cyclase
MVVASTSISPIRLFPVGEAIAPATGVAKDAFGRAMTYLRISLTDRCNFRCVYCMPALGMKFQPKEEHLSDDELLRLIGLFARVGVTKIRLTGGEPTIRRGLVDLVRGIKSFRGITEVSMTTNALLLGRLAEDLADAGLDRVNVSIDTLDPDRFKAMTRGGRLDLVWQGIEAADAAGLRPIKLNTVVVKDQNDFEVGNMAALTIDRPWQVRFLEIMPLEGVGDVHDEALVSSEETQAKLEARFGPLEPIETDPADPARLWKIPGATGTVGFISPVSEPFCAACNRVRLTADGKLRLCLLRPDEGDLRDVMRAGADDETLERAIRAAIWRKPWGHGLAEGERETVRGMSQIGG